VEPHPLSMSILTAREWASLATRVRLSPRERDVLDCLVNGASEKEIAAGLSISVPTVHTHVMRLYRRVGAHNRAELLRFLLLALRDARNREPAG